MPMATLTTGGRVTVPKPIRDRLRLRPGDPVDFVVTATGEIQVLGAHGDARELGGSLRRPNRRPVPVEAMDRAIIAAVSRSTTRR